MKPEFWIPALFIAAGLVWLYWVSLADPPITSLVLQYLGTP